MLIVPFNCHKITIVYLGDENNNKKLKYEELEELRDEVEKVGLNNFSFEKFSLEVNFPINVEVILNDADENLISINGLKTSDEARSKAIVMQELAVDSPLIYVNYPIKFKKIKKFLLPFI